jgi:hypothetical protein
MSSRRDLPESPASGLRGGALVQILLMLIAGVLLVLPGGCVVIVFVLGYVTHPEPAFFQPSALSIFGAGVLTLVGGIVLIRRAVRWRPCRT